MRDGRYDIIAVTNDPARAKTDDAGSMRPLRPRFMHCLFTMTRSRQTPPRVHFRSEPLRRVCIAQEAPLPRLKTEAGRAHAGYTARAGAEQRGWAGMRVWEFCARTSHDTVSGMSVPAYFFVSLSFVFLFVRHFGRGVFNFFFGLSWRPSLWVQPVETFNGGPRPGSELGAGCLSVKHESSVSS